MMKILGKTKYHFEYYRPMIRSVQRMCKRIYVPDYQNWDHQVVHSSSILVTEYKCTKVASILSDRGSNIERKFMLTLMQTWRQVEKGIWQVEHVLSQSNIVKECSLFHWFQRRREFENKGSMFWRIVMVLSSMKKGKIMIKLSLMPTTPGNWYKQVCPGAPWCIPEG